MKSTPLLTTACTIFFTVASLAMADRVTITLNDGSTVEGELVNQNDSTVSVRIGDQVVPYDRANVAKVTKTMSLPEKFSTARQAIDDSNFDARHALAREMFNERTAEGYRLAKGELEAILKANPDHAASKILLDAVNTIMAASEKQTDPASTTTTTPTTPDNGTAADPTQTFRPGQLPVLDKDQITLLKLFESNLSDPNLRGIVVPRPVRMEILEKYRDQPQLLSYLGQQGQEAFLTLPDARVVDIMFRIGANELLKDVRMNAEPEAFRNYIRINSTYIDTYFSRHFGGGKYGGLYLSRGRQQDVAYTNFLNLHRALHENLRFIDRDMPNQSLLLEWGLPRKDARFPAPDVKGWQPYFSGRNDARYVSILRWINSLNSRIDPTVAAKDYPVQFSPAPPVPETEETKDAETDKPAEQPEPEANGS